MQLSSGWVCRPLPARPAQTACDLHRASTKSRSKQRSRVRSSNNGTGEGHSNGSTNNVPKAEEQWQDLAFPTYLQSEVDDFCQDWDEALQREERRQSDISHKDSTIKSRGAVTRDNPVWQAIRKEAAKDAAHEPILSSFLYASVLSHDSFEMALAAILANRLSDPTMMATELIDIFHSVLRGSQEVEQAALADVIAVRERDPACTAYSSALLYYKGYHALQTHRIANGLWQRGQRVLARSLQYRCTQTLAVDIHPAAKIGKGVLLDHGTGLVIGETAVVGNNVSILHNVTLGGTGKEVGDRHPKVNDNVLIGANATILGNISIGKGAQVAAGSLVLKDVPPRTMVAGSPAKEVGKVTGNPALKMQHWMKNQLVKESYAEKWEDIVRSGSINSHTQKDEPSTAARLPAEFGTKDKVPAKGTAPMGLSDYADPSQWTTRGGKVRRREPDEQSAPNLQGSKSKNDPGKTDSARDGGFMGGDGASASGAVSQGLHSAADQKPAITSSQPLHQQHNNGPKQAPNSAETSGRQSDGAAQQASSSGGNSRSGSFDVREDSGPASPSSNGANQAGGKQQLASSDSDWWRELTEASRRSDCSDSASSSNRTSNQQNASRQASDQAQSQPDKAPAAFSKSENLNRSSIASSRFGQNGATVHSPSAQRNTASSGADKQATSPSSSSSAFSGSSAAPSSSSSSAVPSSSSSQKLPSDRQASSSNMRSSQTPAASSKSSRATPKSPQERADIQKRTQQVKEVADKIEQQEPGSPAKADKPKRPRSPQSDPPDIEYWI